MITSRKLLGTPIRRPKTTRVYHPFFLKIGAGARLLFLFFTIFHDTNSYINPLLNKLQRDQKPHRPHTVSVKGEG